jgi:hypothetical protein
MPVKSHKTHPLEEYALLSLPENPKLFAVERKAIGSEQFVKKDPNGEELGAVYHSVIHFVSPFYNYYTGEPTESCTCISWRSRQERCIHLRKFYEMNPDLEPKEIPKKTPKEVEGDRKTLDKT